MQRLCVFEQVPLDLIIGAWPHLPLAVGEVFVRDGFERLSRPLFAFGLLSCGILPEPDLGMEFAGDLARLDERHCGGRAERHAALFLPKRVLKNPITRTTFANPEAKSREVIFPEDVIGLSC